MDNEAEQLYIAHWVDSQGLIEIRQDEYSSSLVRLLDKGGLVWKSSNNKSAVKMLVLEKGGVV